MPNCRNLIILHPQDNVAVALEDIQAGDMLAGEIVARSAIPKGHKIALCRIDVGQPIFKYGYAIGLALEAISSGEWIHLHNTRVSVEGLPTNVVPLPVSAPFETEPSLTMPTFKGYLRPDGRTGTRNYLIVASTVSCANATARAIISAARVDAEIGLRSGIDGILPILHTQGCGMIAESPGFHLLKRTLAGCINHPNVGGALVLGLGCEMNAAAELSDLVSASGAGVSRIRYLEIQSCGGTSACIGKGLAALRELAQDACRFKRSPVCVSELCMAVQCGGSDAFSGISANPALGVAADLLVQAGGQVILSETPEIFGAEHLLMERAETENERNALRRKIEWWKQYTKLHGGTVNNNPAPGNHRGGLTTIVEKALGAVSKGGTTPLRDVVDYASTSCRKGLVFMDSPGYDPVSVTGQIAAGATIIGFTTGLGSSYGAFLSPVLKITSNSDTFRRLKADMDIDCGGILNGNYSIDAAGRDIFNTIVAVASGKKTCAEVSFNGEDLFIPWHIGAVM
jgi:altronate hydrolase